MQGCKGSAGCYDRQAAEQGQQIQEDHIGNGRQQRHKRAVYIQEFHQNLLSVVREL